MLQFIPLLDIMHQRKDLEENKYLENLKLADELSRMLY